MAQWTYRYTDITLLSMRAMVGILGKVGGAERLMAAPAFQW